MSRRVVVTGLGVLSCVGHDVDTFWNNLCSGYCGIDNITSVPVEQLCVKVGGEIRDFRPEEFGMDRAFIRKQDKFTIYAVASAYQAMKDSGLVCGENIDPFRMGTYISSAIGGIETTQREILKFAEEPSGEWVSPNLVPTMIGNMGAGQVAIHFGAKGSCLDIVTACATSTHSLGEAYRAIKDGYLDAIMAGGSDHAIIPIGLAAFANTKALSRETDPKHASLPFNLNRSGFVMADGSGALVLEEYEHAVARGAKIYCEVVGYGSTCDAYHATAPCKDGSTQAGAISMALEQAGFDASRDKLYINAHGTGTYYNDLCETRAYKIALGEDAYKAHISSTKSMHGHMLGATGAVEAIACVLALRDGIIPPTINLDAADPECDLDYTPNVAVRDDVNVAISSNFGFGGHNGCIAFRKL